MAEEERFRKCKKIKKDGTLCESWSVAGYDFCNFHQFPNAASEAGYKGSQGNRNYPKTSFIDADAPPLKLEAPSDVLKMIEQTVDDVRKNRIRPDQASMMAYLGNVALQAMRTEMGGKDDEKPVPEIREIERSNDQRAVGDKYPGSEFGEEQAN